MPPTSHDIKGAIDLSILVPVFNEADSIDHFYLSLSSALDSLDKSAEIIFCDDGSTDESGAILDRLATGDDRVTAIHLRRNYGQTAAIMAALQESVGDVVIPIDADGQNDPADIPLLLAMLDDGFDVVSGWRKNRQDRALSRRLPSVIANKLISAVLGVRLHDYGCTLKAYRREVIEDVRLYGEMHRFIPVYAAWEGARVTEMPVRHHPRKFGTSKYGIGRVIRVVLDLIVLHFIDRSFDRPIQFFGKLGVGFLGFAVTVFCWALGLKYIEGTSLIQTPLPLLAASLGLSGLLFILLGIVAEVQARIYFESRGKAPYKIRRVTRHQTPPLRAVQSNRW